MKEKYPVNVRFVHYFELGEGFFVDVVLTKNEVGDDVLDFWLYHKNYGVKEHQFGIVHTFLNIEEYLDEISEVGIPSYKEQYAPELLD